VVARVLTLVMAMLLLVGSVVAPRGAAAAPAEPTALIEVLAIDDATVPPAIAPAEAPPISTRTLAMPAPRVGDGRLHAITIFRPPRD
jgi:hypothetical protein